MKGRMFVGGSMDGKVIATGSCMMMVPVCDDVRPIAVTDFSVKVEPPTYCREIYLKRDLYGDTGLSAEIMVLDSLSLDAVIKLLVQNYRPQLKDDGK